MSPQLCDEEKAAYTKLEPPCPYFGTCGGCALQDLDYQDQLALKAGRIRRALAPLEEHPDVHVVGLDEPWRYRNKAELTFGTTSSGRMALGYHAPRSFWRVVDLDDCLLLPEPVTGLLRDVRRLAEATGLPAYAPRTHQGFFRYLVVRHAHTTGRILLCLITAPGPAPGSPGGVQGELRAAVARMGAELMRRHPALASVYWGVTDRISDVARPDAVTLLGGSPQLDDTVGPFRIRLDPFSFLQPSHVQAERIYAAVHEAVGRGGGVLWDLYCGIGLVGMYCARSVRTVYGIDVEPNQLALASENAARNGLHNLQFRAGPAEAVLMNRRFWLQEAKPDAVVVDPPRIGLHPQVLASVLAARPRLIAYLSCNVQSLVRDLQVIRAGFPRYRLAGLQAFDMFPQTDHVETLALLMRP